MTIVNEQFIISNVSQAQYKSYFAETPAPSTSAASGIQDSAITQPENALNAPAIQNIPPELVGLNEQQVLMIREFSAQSRLNLEWSKQ